MAQNGSFIISLDYELMWGVRDSRLENEYGVNILNVSSVIERTLALSQKYNIGITVATVGFLFQKDKEALLVNLPKIVPTYFNDTLSPFVDMKNFLTDTNNDALYFNFPVTKSLIESANIEVASHTYSHFYCLESRNNEGAFNADTALMKKIASENGVSIKSIVFPRNQYTKEHVAICKKFGITSYRGTPNHWIYKPSASNEQGTFKRLLRLLDSYFNITGHHCHNVEEISNSEPYNIAASRFLRPYSKSLSALEKTKLKRIKKSMTHAAKNKLLYHLWWHPHNFGSNLEKNMEGLLEIFEHYKTLQEKYGFISITMGDLSQNLNKNR